MRNGERRGWQAEAPAQGRACPAPGVSTFLVRSPRLAATIHLEWSTAQPGGRKILAHGVSRGEQAGQLPSPGTGRKSMPHSFTSLLVHVVFLGTVRVPNATNWSSRLVAGIPVIPEEAWHPIRYARPLGLRTAFRPVPGLAFSRAVPHGLRRGLGSFALRASRMHKLQGPGMPGPYGAPWQGRSMPCLGVSPIL